MFKQLADEQILRVIDSLKGRNQKVTGLAVRTELRRRFGMPGGVERIYRLIGETKAPPRSEAHELQDEVVLLRQQLAAAIQRAELAEHRERVHQEKWVMEVDLLRQQLRAAQIDVRKLSESQNQVLELRRELHRLSGGSS